MFEIGDVIYKDNGVIQHPYIACEYQGQHRLVHMKEDGPLIIGSLPYGGTYAKFRCVNRELSLEASRYATSWSFAFEGELPGYGDVATNDAALTPYAAPGTRTARYYGWQAHRHSGETAPFEHDALYRAFKWAGRLEGTASAKKGMTCDVFICACFHAAAIYLLYGGDLDRIQAKAKVLGADRKDLKPSADRHAHQRSPSGSVFENSVLRGWSNAGATPGQDPAFLGHWKSTLSDGSHVPETLDEVFTTALLVDGKFTHGAQLKARMESDQKWWQKV